MKVLKRFLERPAAFMQETPEEGYYDEKAHGEESAFQKAFEAHIAVLEKSTSDLKREIVGLQEESAAKSQALSESEATLAATMDQKDTDETIFSSTRDQCKSKSDEWDERGRLRNEQID